MKLYIFNNTLAYERDDGNNSWPPAIAGTLSFIFSNGNSTLICGQQWDRVKDELNKLQLEDSWEFQSIIIKGHQYGIGVSKNPKDPKIIFDPWRDTFKQTLNK